MLVALFLTFHQDVRRFRLEAGHLDRARGAVIEQAHRVLVGLDDAHPPALGLERDQLAANHRDDRDIPPVLFLRRLQFLDGVDDRPIQRLDRVRRATGLFARPGGASLGNRIVVAVRPVVQEHPALVVRLQSVIFRDPHRSAGALVARHPVLRVRPERRQLVLGERRHLAVRIPPLVGLPRHVVDDERPLGVRPVRFLRERVHHHAGLLENALDHNPLVERTAPVWVALRNHPVIAAAGLHRPLKRPTAGQVRPTLDLDAPVEPLDDLRRVVVRLVRQRMDAHPEVRGLLGVEGQLDGLVEARNRQHRPLRDGDAAHQLRFPLLLHVVRPGQLRHLEPERIDLALPLVAVRIDAQLEPVQRLRDVARCVCHKVMPTSSPWCRPPALGQTVPVAAGPSSSCSGQT